jgi:trehalose-phosphatase
MSSILPYATSCALRSQVNLAVVPRKGNKGQIVKKVLENCKEVDFVLCMGDDVSDEKMFTVRSDQSNILFS